MKYNHINRDHLKNFFKLKIWITFFLFQVNDEDDEDDDDANEDFYDVIDSDLLFHNDQHSSLEQRDDSQHTLVTTM